MEVVLDALYAPTINYPQSTRSHYTHATLGLVADEHL